MDSIFSIPGDIHEVWIDPKDNQHMLIGSDLGLQDVKLASKDRSDNATTFESLNLPPIAQYYAIGYDMRKPYWIYGGIQDRNCWAIPTQTTHGGVSVVDASRLIFDDGGQNKAWNPEDWTTVYSLGRPHSAVRIDCGNTAKRKILHPL